MIEKLLEKTGLDSFACIIAAAAVLLLGFLALKLIMHILRKGLKKSSIDPALHKFITNLVRIAGWIFIVVAVLSELNVNTTTFVAVLSAAGAAIALALKDSLANVAGGIIILLTKPFGREEYIKIGDSEGQVMDIDIMNTVITTVDQKTVIIPNGTVTSSSVTNYSRQGIRRVDCVFEVGYDSDLDRVKEILAEVEKNCPLTLHDREPVIGISAHGENGVSVDFKVWTNNSAYWDTYYYIQENVKNAFDRESIEIPYPHMEVRLHNQEL